LNIVNLGKERAREQRLIPGFFLSRQFEFSFNFNHFPLHRVLICILRYVEEFQ